MCTLRLFSQQSRSSEYLSLYFVLCKTLVNRTPINSAQSIIVGITRRPFQVPLRVRVRFHDSVGDIDFYQMSLSQSESTFLHESIIYDLRDEYNFTLRYTQKCI